MYLILSFFSPFTADGLCVFKCLLNRDTECCRVGRESVLITLGYNSALLKFESHAGKFCAGKFPGSPAFLRTRLLIGWLCCSWLVGFGSVFPDVSCHELRGWLETGVYLTLWLGNGQPFRRVWACCSPCPNLQDRPPRMVPVLVTIVASSWRWGCLQKCDVSIGVQFRMILPCFYLCVISWTFLDSGQHMSSSREVEYNQKCLKKGQRGILEDFESAQENEGYQRLRSPLSGWRSFL